MNDFKQRLLDEKQQLDERIGKLEAFIESDEYINVDGHQMSLLNIQLYSMLTYSQILLERIVLPEYELNPKKDN
jgi:hypothetical protein